MCYVLTTVPLSGCDQRMQWELAGALLALVVGAWYILVGTYLEGRGGVTWPHPP